MALIDTHTHLESFARKGILVETLDRAKAVGVGMMITIGTGPDDWGLYQDLAVTHPALVRFTAGLHPCSVGEDWEEALRGLEGFWISGHGRPAPVALGECGLDRFHLPKDPAATERIFGWQQAAFERQLQLARRLECPVVVHSRGAFHECVAMVDAAGVDWSRVVFHCFTEGEAEMNELTRRGGFGSFTGILTYKNADPVRAAARRQGLARFMIETDAPYLTPMPHRGKPNEPAFIRHTAEYAAADVFGVPYEELVDTTAGNARAFFGI